MLKKFFFIIVMIFFAKLSFSQLMWVEQTSGTTQTLTSAHSNAATFESYVWVCGYGGTVLRSTNNGVSWVSVGGNGIPTTTLLINIVSLDQNTAVTAGYVGANTFVYRTSNGGANWTQVFTESNGFINAICFMPSTSNGFIMGDPVGGRWSLWKTSNGGVNWDSSGLYLQQVGSEAGWNNSLWCFDNRIWFGTNNTKIYYSTNFGSSWTAQATTGSVNSYAVWFYRLTGGDEGLTGGTALLRSSNYGTNWTSQTSIGSGNFGGITGGPNIITDAKDFIYTFYIRSSNIIYTSSNNGTNWFSQYTAPTGTYRYIGTDYYATKFWAVRNNGGISYLDFTVGITLISSEIPDRFSLHQNHPNPFNPKTIINYELRVTSYILLKIYNAIGNEVATLINQRQNAGSYSVEFDGSNYPSGIYYYKLEAGDFREVRKMILIK